MAPISIKATNLYREQKRAFDLLVEDVENQVKVTPLVLLVHGAAGTGKSEIIKHLLAYFGSTHVMITSATALAARNVQGSTIHKAFQISTEGGFFSDDFVLPDPALKLVIIDEVSMCDKDLFERIEKRLRQLMGKPNVLFGGCTVVLFGDLLQIPPVSGEWIFTSNIWKNHVKYIELEEVVRQETDPKFGKMLKRWRLGIVTKKDEDFLNGLSRKVSQTGWDDYVSYFLKNYDKTKQTMILCHTNSSVGTLNSKITQRLFKPDEQLPITRDTYTLPEGGNDWIRTEQLMFNVGLDSRVIISKNSRRDDVANGDIGLVKFIRTVSSRRVVGLDIELSSSKETRSIHLHVSPVVTVNSTKTCIASLPVYPAYAVTYHKSQGQTLDQVFLVAREKLPPALFYVGASRVRTRKDLHVLTPDASKSIHVDNAAMNEYVRLRRSVGKPDLPDM